MGTICGANCEECRGRDECRGCAETCGSPFGGRCIAAEYIKAGGRAAYDEFRRQLLDEINSLLEAEGLPHALALYELPGQYVNLEYPTPGGERVRLLSDNDIYLGTQIEFADRRHRLYTHMQLQPRRQRPRDSRFQAQISISAAQPASSDFYEACSGTA